MSIRRERKSKEEAEKELNEALASKTRNEFDIVGLLITAFESGFDAKTFLFESKPLVHVFVERGWFECFEEILNRDPNIDINTLHDKKTPLEALMFANITEQKMLPFCRRILSKTSIDFRSSVTTTTSVTVTKTWTMTGHFCKPDVPGARRGHFIKGTFDVNKGSGEAAHGWHLPQNCRRSKEVTEQQPATTYIDHYPLIFAVRNGLSLVVEHILLRSKPDLERTYAGTTALMSAAARGFVSIVKRLVEAGAKVSALSSSGNRTPLMFAIEYKHFEVCEFLRKHDQATSHAWTLSCYESAIQSGSLSNFLLFGGDVSPETGLITAMKYVQHEIFSDIWYKHFVQQNTEITDLVLECAARCHSRQMVEIVMQKATATMTTRFPTHFLRLAVASKCKPVISYFLFDCAKAVRDISTEQINEIKNSITNDKELWEMFGSRLGMGIGGGIQGMKQEPW